MEEITEVHSLNLEWGCITNLMDKIVNIEDNMDEKWEEMIDMLADAVMEEQEKKADPATTFFNLYQFMFRFYYRLRANPYKRPFNKVSKTTANGETAFMIQNYDYATFKWLKTIGCGDRISNDYAYVPTTKLNDKQRRKLEIKASK